MCRVIVQCDKNGCVAGECDGAYGIVKAILMLKYNRGVDVYIMMLHVRLLW
jgi:hypothetical protein